MHRATDTGTASDLLTQRAAQAQGTHVAQGDDHLPVAFAGREGFGKSLDTQPVPPGRTILVQRVIGNGQKVEVDRGLGVVLRLEGEAAMGDGPKPMPTRSWSWSQDAANIGHPDMKRVEY